MRCKRFLSQMERGREAVALKKHAASCAACREAKALNEKILASLKRVPEASAPDHLWEQIARQTVRAQTRPQPSWTEKLRALLENLSLGDKLAWSSALTAAAVFLLVWTQFPLHKQAPLQVVELSADAVNAFPSYFREHQNPSRQPISDGAMVLAFNTLKDRA